MQILKGAFLQMIISGGCATVTFVIGLILDPFHLRFLLFALYYELNCYKNDFQKSLHAS